MKTVGDMIGTFRHVFGLKAGKIDTFHDGVHAMTGIGVGVADELRIIAVETGLEDAARILEPEDAKNQIIDAWAMAQAELTSPHPASMVRNGIENEQSLRIQQGTELITDAEIKALYKLGDKMRTAILDLTGKEYLSLRPVDILVLDFSKVDFSAEALAIKKAHETPENRAVAVALARMFRNTARAKGKDNGIPRATASWVDYALKR